VGSQLQVPSVLSREVDLPVAEEMAIGADTAGIYYVAVVKSGSGKVFYSIDKANGRRDITPRP
jgi:hypothetical protein